MTFLGGGGPSLGFAPVELFVFAMWLEIIRNFGREDSISVVALAGWKGRGFVEGSHF